MPLRSTVLLNILVTFGLLLTGALVDFPFSAGTSAALASAPEVLPEDSSGPALASRRAQRKQARRDERRHGRERDRTRDRTKADRTQDRTRKDRKQDRQASGQTADESRVGDWRQFCDSPDSIQLPGSDSCTHGPDPAPPGFTIEQPVQPLAKETSAAETAAIACDGDGQSGYRVQVLYVHASDVTSRYTQYLASIRGWAAAADQIFQASAGETGGSRGLRFVHDASCQPTVQEVKVSANGDGNFGTTISEFKSLGYNRTDRIYLAFVDTRAAGICGIGTLWSDDRASSANWNNSGPSYSRVDNGCWSGSVAAHELMHNLGGVQDSAPNSSRGGHCIDQYDVMCYSDSPYYPAMQNPNPCPVDKSRFDCGHNDYFHTNPAPGSYLANFWNSANNRFLTNAAALPAPPPPPPPAPPAPPVVDDTTTTTSKDKKDKKGKHKKGKNHKKRR